MPRGSVKPWPNGLASPYASSGFANLGRLASTCESVWPGLNAYMREYRKKRKADVNKQNCNPYMKEYRKRKNSVENKQKKNAYMREYRNKKQSEQKKQNVQDEYEIQRSVNDNVETNNITLQTENQHHQRRPEDHQRRSESVQYLISKFHDIVSKGPLYICSCCDQLWYKHSVSSAVKLREANLDIHKYLNKKSVNNMEWLCRSCHNYLAKNKVPPCAAVNGMQFPPKPAFFYLNDLECRLLAPRLAFQKLMQAPRGKQLKINGNIVNVPADVSHTVSMLPRLPNETGTIKVNLKRRLQYKSSALSLNVSTQNSASSQVACE